MRILLCPALRRALPLAVLAAALAGCGDKSETEQLADLRDGLAYTNYRRVSENGMPAAIAAYRKGAQWSGQTPPVEFSEADICAMHVLLAYGALIADKGTIALAESDIVEAGDCAPFDRVAANSLRSVVFRRQQWPQLAQAESDKAWAAPKQAGQDKAPAEQVMILHVTLAYLAVSEQRWDRAQLHIDALAQLLRQPWMSDLPRAGIAFKEGRTGDGLVALKHMSQDPTAPPEVRAELARFIAKIEAKGGDVDSFAFMPRLVAVLTWEAIKQEGPDVLKTTARFAEQQAWKPLNDSVSSGAGKAREVAGSWWNKARDAVMPAEATDEPGRSDPNADNKQSSQSEANKPAPRS
jgi:hypothetical protein